jgi:hypothetical protein
MIHISSGTDMSSSTVTRITEKQLIGIKRRAKQLSRQDKTRTYMQHLDFVCQEQLGVGRFQDASKQAVRAEPVTPLSLYLQACQDAYFEI